MSAEIKKIGQSPLVVTSGGLTPYYSIIHVVIRDVTLGEELSSYQQTLATRLEAGIRMAEEQQSRRPVICTDSIQPDRLNWKDAEKIIQAVEWHMYLDYGEAFPCEIVQVTLSEQSEEKRAEMLEGLKKLTKIKETNQGIVTTRKYEALNQGSGEDSDSGAEEEAGSVVKKYSYTKPSGPQEEPLKLKEHQKPGQIAAKKRAPTMTPEVTPKPAPRDRHSTPKPTDSPVMEEEEEPSRISQAASRQGRVEVPDSDQSPAEDFPTFASDLEKRIPIKTLARSHYQLTTKDVELFDITNQSYKMARDKEYGPLRASGGRNVYMPEMGQIRYNILSSRLEDRPRRTTGTTSKP